MANASSIAHRLPTKTGQLQSFRCRTQTKYASAAAAQALLHRSRPSSTPSSPSRRLLACRPGARARVRVRPAGKPVGEASRPQGVQGGCTAASRARSPGRARLLDAHRRPLQAATPDPGLPAWSLDHLRRAAHLRGGVSPVPIHCPRQTSPGAVEMPFPTRTLAGASACSGRQVSTGLTGIVEPSARALRECYQVLGVRPLAGDASIQTGAVPSC